MWRMTWWAMSVGPYVGLDCRGLILGLTLGLTLTLRLALTLRQEGH